MSSSSSLGSLSSSKASSKGSLSSLSFTDIYGMSATQPSDPAMIDLHRRVEKILMGSSPNSQPTLSNGPQSSHQHNPHHQNSVMELNCIGEHYGEPDDRTAHSHRAPNQVGLYKPPQNNALFVIKRPNF